MFFSSLHQDGVVGDNTVVLPVAWVHDAFGAYSSPGLGDPWHPIETAQWLLIPGIGPGPTSRRQSGALAESWRPYWHGESLPSFLGWSHIPHRFSPTETSLGLSTARRENSPTTVRFDGAWSRYLS